MCKFLHKLMSPFLKVIPRSKGLGHVVNLFEKHSEKVPDSLPKQLHHFTFPSAVYEGSDFFTA